MTTYAQEEGSPFYTIDGSEHCDVEAALSELLAEEVVFANSRKYVCLDGSIQPETIVLFVNCNDLFYWACSDTETLKYSEVGDLYRAWKSGPWGVSRWCCIHRGQRPQRPVEKHMREAGAWDDVLEALPAEAPSERHTEEP